MIKAKQTRVATSVSCDIIEKRNSFIKSRWKCTASVPRRRWHSSQQLLIKVVLGDNHFSAEEQRLSPGAVLSLTLCALPSRHCPALCVSLDQITVWGDVWTRVRFLPQKGRLCVICANLSPERWPGFLGLPHQPCRRTVVGKWQHLPSTLPEVETHRGHRVWLNHWTHSFNLYLIPVCSAARQPVYPWSFRKLTPGNKLYKALRWGISFAWNVCYVSIGTFKD